MLADEAVEATFNVKDFRAMLGLCDSLGCQIKLLFQGPGDPLVAEPHFAGHHDAVRAGFPWQVWRGHQSAARCLGRSPN